MDSLHDNNHRQFHDQYHILHVWFCRKPPYILCGKPATHCSCWKYRNGSFGLPQKKQPVLRVCYFQALFKPLKNDWLGFSLDPHIWLINQLANSHLSHMFRGHFPEYRPYNSLQMVSACKILRALCRNRGSMASGKLMPTPLGQIWAMRQKSNSCVLH